MFNKLMDKSYDGVLKLTERMNYDDSTNRSICFNYRSVSFSNFDNAFSVMK